MDARPIVLGAEELGRVLGVTRGRLWQLAAKPWFPPPLATLAMGRVWLLDDILAMAADRGRTLHTGGLATPSPAWTPVPPNRGGRRRTALPHRPATATPADPPPGRAGGG